MEFRGALLYWVTDPAGRQRGPISHPILMTDDHPASSHGQPVVVSTFYGADRTGYGPAELLSLPRLSAADAAAGCRVSRVVVSLSGPVPDTLRAALIHLGYPLKHATQAEYESEISGAGRAFAALKQAEDDALRSGEIRP